MASNALRPVRPLYAIRPVRPLYAIRPVRPLYAIRPVRPLYALRPVRPLYALRPVRPLLAILAKRGYLSNLDRINKFTRLSECVNIYTLGTSRNGMEWHGMPWTTFGRKAYAGKANLSNP